MKFLKKFDHWLLIHIALILACIVGAAIFIFVHQGAEAGWDDSVYTPYSAGIYPITVPTPGVHTYYAKDSAGVVQAMGVVRYDPDMPTFESESMIFVADNIKDITLHFSDHGLSGVASVQLKIFDSHGNLITHSASGETMTFIHDFSRAGNYDLQYRITDNASNDTGWVTYSDFFIVVAGEPEWLADNCSGDDYSATCPSTITVTSGVKIADGVDPHTITLKLVDKYGNPIIPVSGVKGVKINFVFNNTDYLDQISQTGDAMHIVLRECDIDLMGANTGNTMIDSTGPLSEKLAGADGVYEVDAYAFAPTYDGYPLLGNDIRFGLDYINYEIGPQNSLSGVGEDNGRKNSRVYLAFSPALTASPQAMNFVDGAYSASEDAMQNITINAAKRFLLSFSNASLSKTASDIELGLLIRTSDSDVAWGKTFLEKSHGSSVNQALGIVTTEPMTAMWNLIPAAANSADIGETKYIRLQSTPVLRLSGRTYPTFATLFRAHVGYDINGRHPRYRSGRVSVGSIEDSSDDLVTMEVRNTNIQVIGVSHSDSAFGFTSTLENQQANSSLGDVFRSEFRTIITRNVAAYTNSASMQAKACQNSSYTITSSNWDTFPCRFRDNSVLYFEGADVTFEDDSASALKLPSGIKTIIVKGGNVKIKSNLIYDAKKDSFGLILLRDDDSRLNPLDQGGNLFIDPDITNISLALYAEGSVVSMNNASQYDEYSGTNCPTNGSGGFCDRSTELRNQLYWQGSLISQNTIGGSDMNPPVCPSQFESDACNDRDAARIFDLNYIRTFHALSGGKRAGGINSLGLDSDLLLPNPPDGISNNHAFIIKYDSRIKTNPPPLFLSATTTGSGQVIY